MLLHNIEYEKEIDPQAKDLIDKILKLDPKERPSITQIDKHPYLT